MFRWSDSSPRSGSRWSADRRRSADHRLRSTLPEHSTRNRQQRTRSPRRTITLYTSPLCTSGPMYCWRINSAHPPAFSHILAKKRRTRQSVVHPSLDVLWAPTLISTVLLHYRFRTLLSFYKFHTMFVFHLFLRMFFSHCFIRTVSTCSGSNDVNEHELHDWWR